MNLYRPKKRIHAFRDTNSYLARDKNGKILENGMAWNDFVLLKNDFPQKSYNSFEFIDFTQLSLDICSSEVVAGIKPNCTLIH